MGELFDALFSEGENLSTGQGPLDQIIAAYRPPPAAPEPEADFTESFSRGFLNTNNLMSNGLNMWIADFLYDKTGSETFKQISERNAADYQGIHEAIQKKYPRAYDDLRDIEGVGDFFGYAKERIGEGLPSLLPSLATGGLAAATVKKGTEDFIRKKMIAMAAGAGASSALQTIPEAHIGILEKGGYDPDTALFAGLLSASLEAIPQVHVFKKFFGEELSDKAGQALNAHLVGRITGGAISTGWREGLTEAAQEAINIAAENFVIENEELFTEENLFRVLESGLAGSLVGKVTGGIAGGLANPKAAADVEIETESIPIGEEEKAVRSLFPQSGLSYHTTPEEMAAEIKRREEEAKTLESAEEIEKSTQELEQLKQFHEKLKEFKEYNRKTVQQSRLKASQKSVKVASYGDQKIAADEGFQTPKIEQRPIYLPDSTEKLAQDGSPAIKLLTGPNQEEQDRNEFYRLRALETERQAKLESPEAAYVLDELKKHHADAGLDEVAIARQVAHMEMDQIRRMAQRIKKAKDAKDVNELREIGTIFVDPTNQEFFNSVEEIEQRQKEKVKRRIEARHRQEEAARQSRRNEHLPQQRPQSESTYSGIRPRDVPDDGVFLQGDGVITHVNSEPDYAGRPEMEKFVKQEAQKTYRKERAKAAPRDEKGRFIKKPDTTPNFQKPLPGSAEQQFERHTVLPTTVENGLNYTPLTPRMREGYGKLLENLERIVKEVAGPTAKFKPVNFLSSKGHIEDPVRGAQFQNLIYVSLYGDRTNAQMEETALHEAWHVLREWLDPFTKKEKAVLEREYPRMKKRLLELTGIKEGELDSMWDSSETARREVEANLFGLMAQAQRSGKPINLKQPALTRIFDKAMNFIRRLGNYLRGNGFQTFEDIFETTADGGKSVHDQRQVNLDNIRQVRLHDFENEVRHGHRAANNPDQALNEAQQAAQGSNDKKWSELASAWGRYMQSIRKWGSNDPFIGYVYTLKQREMDDSSERLHRYNKYKSQVDALPEPIRNKIYDIADRVRNARTKARIVDGFLQYRDSRGVLQHIRSIDGDADAARVFAQQYVNLQKAFGEVLSDYDDLTRNELENMGFDRDLTPDAITEMLENINPEQEKDKFNRLSLVRSQLAQIAELGSKDFVPHMRFGKYYRTVFHRDRPDTPAAYYMIEKGRHLGQYDKFQFDEVETDIQERFSGPEYIVHGWELADQKEYLRNLSPGIETLEIISALLGGADPDLYQGIYEKLVSKAALKGFEERFAKSRNIHGYSRDWDRVGHAYMTGAANFFARQKYQPEWTQVENALPKLANDHVRKGAEEFMKYVNNPVEDMHKLRAMNFFWTMGFNTSTAALQLMTLPTTTLGVLTQFDSNVIANAARISKWMGKGLRYFGTHFNDNPTDIATQVFRFDDEQYLDRLVRDNVMDQGHADLLKLAVQRERLSGLSTKEYVGGGRETRSRYGKAVRKFSRVAEISGFMISSMEQMTRFATLSSAYETLQKPGALDRAMRVYAKDQAFQAFLKNNADMDLKHAVALFAMDDAHAVFGKLGRAKLQRSVGGAVVIPFMAYPQQAVEFMGKMALHRGHEGRLAFAATATSLVLLSGLMGLPGGELMKELLEEVYAKYSGRELELDMLIRAKLAQTTGEPRAGLFLTQGVLRGGLDWDVSRRIGLPIVGQEILLNMLGIRGDTSDLLGVSGSIMQNGANAWKHYAEGGSNAEILANLLPVAAGNAVKALNYADEGVRTQKGTQLVAPKEITGKDQILRGMGITSGNIADRRERLFFKQVAERQFQPGLDKYRSTLKNIDARRREAIRKGDTKAAAQEYQDFRQTMAELRLFIQENNIPVDMRSFMRSVRESTSQRMNPGDWRAGRDPRRTARQYLHMIDEITSQMK